MDRRTRNKSQTRKKEKETEPVISPAKRKAVEKKKSPEPKRKSGRGRPPKKRAPTPSDSESESSSRSPSPVSNRNNVQRSGSRKSDRIESRRSEEAQGRSAGVRGLSIALNDVSVKMSDVTRRSLSRDIEDLQIKRKTLDKTDRLSTHSEFFETVTKTNNISKVEFGGGIGAAIQILITFAIIFGTLLGCTKDQCSLKPFHIPRNWRVYLNWQSSAAVLAFIVCQTLFSLLPLGRVVKSTASSTWYRSNGCLALILTGGTVGGLWYLGYPVSRIYEWYIPAAVASYALAILLSGFLYLKARNARLLAQNPYGNSGNVLYDLFVGREINPIIFGRINVKIVLLRFAIIGSILIDALLALKAYEVRKEVSPTLATLIGLKIFYCLDYLWFEELFVSSFESQYEAVGLMTAQGFLLWPFFTAVLTRFVLTHSINVPTYSLVISGVVFALGYFIYRASNLQKATFRSNPTAPAIAHLQTIRTDRGKRLLVSGWWGWVKHPNYLGDIILTWATASVIGFSNALPFIVPAVTTIFLLHRAKRDESRCRERYEKSWDEYDSKVPYLILPRVY